MGQQAAQHTPGPWSDPCTFGASKFEIHGERKQIAVVNRIEDARLISAAPDLLAALQMICDSGAPLSDEITDAMTAALRKANGEQVPA